MDDARLVRCPADLQGWLGDDPRRAKLVAFVGQWPELVYLVGGSVRDALLGRDTMDLDLAVDGSALTLARALADRSGGALVVLDAERDVARVVIGRGVQAEHWDLAGLRAPTIEGDLCARDLTVNAMALTLCQPHVLVDPMGGYGDLRRGLLRAADDRAFCEDPVRVLRLARFRGELGFAVWPPTRRLAAEAVGSLGRVSPERLRDELFAILRLEGAAEALGYLRRLGALAAALGVGRKDAVALDTGLARLRALEGWAGRRLKAGNVGAQHAVPLPHHPCLRPQGDVRVDGGRGVTGEGWGRVLAGGRTRWQATKLAAMLIGMAPRAAEAACVAMRLSTVEVRWVRDTVAGAQALEAGLDGSGDVALYRYYRRFGEAGVDGAVLALVGGGATKAREVLPAWFDRHQQVVDPPRLVTGLDVMHALGVASGPAIGEALETIREAQVAGKIASREDALRWLRCLARGKCQAPR